jgi:signal recognition particle subunit SRP54
MGAKSEFTLNDFRKQLNARGGSPNLMAGMIDLPSGSPLEDPKQALQHLRRIIDAMTEEERLDPDGIDLGRRQRIAAESDTKPEDVEQFLKQFKQIRKLMRKMARMSTWQHLKFILGFEMPPPHDEDDE